MRFKVDENLPNALADLFVEAGHDTVSVEDQGLAGESDETIADICRDEARALVTLDTDFADIRVFPPPLYGGIVVLRPKSQGVRSVLNLGERFLNGLENESLAGKLWIVEEERIRVRD